MVRIPGSERLDSPGSLFAGLGAAQTRAATAAAAVMVGEAGGSKVRLQRPRLAEALVTKWEFLYIGSRPLLGSLYRGIL